MGEISNIEKVKQAWETTPVQYHKYIMVLQGKPYMTVAGRLAMAMDEHRKEGAKLTYKTELLKFGEKIAYCKTIIESPLRGYAEGVAQIKFGGKGADATDPIENASTSSCGRALRFLGYDVDGGSVASADDMERVVSAEAADPPAVSPEPANSQPASATADVLANDRQIALFYHFGRQLNISERDMHNWAWKEAGSRDPAKLTSDQIEGLIGACKDAVAERAPQAPAEVSAPGSAATKGPSAAQIKRLRAIAKAKGVVEAGWKAYMVKHNLGLDAHGTPSVTRLTKLGYEQVCAAIENGHINPVGTDTVIAEASHVGDELVANGETVNTATGEIKEGAKV